MPALFYCSSADAQQHTASLVHLVFALPQAGAGMQLLELLPLSARAPAGLLVQLLAFQTPAVRQAAYDAVAAAMTAEAPALQQATAFLLGDSEVLRQLIVHGFPCAAVRRQAGQILQAAAGSQAGLQALAPWEAWLACYAANAEVGSAMSGVLAQLEEHR